jgi:hypothetical protein
MIRGSASEKSGRQIKYAGALVFKIKCASHFSKILVPVKSPKPRFEHRPALGMPERLASYCIACRDFIAASNRPEYLRIAEKAHVCPQKRRRKKR